MGLSAEFGRRWYSTGDLAAERERGSTTQRSPSRNEGSLEPRWGSVSSSMPRLRPVAWSLVAPEVTDRPGALPRKPYGRGFVAGAGTIRRCQDVGLGDVDGERKAMLVDHEVDLDALDLLAAVDAACRRSAPNGGAAVHHHDRRLRVIAAGQPPASAAGRASAPQPEPLPAREAGIQPCRTAGPRDGTPSATACRSSRRTRCT